ncbi:hypothetical protein PQC38_gp022 [Aeromonas phage BUCT695]|uniref:hypothetical protein n=1 Tax=Aeromonas phage BUCT695 TaxID=2908630 RepID=UPI00232946C2|nr:hypothetical protein PQC38_gp022 [Aeromonas phage BUCT695]UIW10498.1 hypothetical protein [Aeromonas phage BUCT695]
MNVTVKAKNDAGVKFNSIVIGTAFKYGDNYYIRADRVLAIRYSPDKCVTPELTTFGPSLKVFPLPDTEIIFK